MLDICLLVDQITYVQYLILDMDAEHTWEVEGSCKHQSSDFNRGRISLPAVASAEGSFTAMDTVHIVDGRWTLLDNWQVGVVDGGPWLEVLGCLKVFDNSRDR